MKLGWFLLISNSLLFLLSSKFFQEAEYTHKFAGGDLPKELLNSEYIRHQIDLRSLLLCLINSVIFFSIAVTSLMNWHTTR